MVSTSTSVPQENAEAETIPSTSNVKNANDVTLPTITPINVLIVSSIPVLSGAILGYRKEVARGASDTHFSVGGLISRFFKTSSSAKNNRGSAINTSSVNNTVASSRPALSVAVRAFAVGSLLSVGGVGLFSAGVLYIAGCDSISSFVDKCREWAPLQKRKLESSFGLSLSSSSEEELKNDVDVKATANMNEDDEIEFYKRKYMPDLYDESDDTE
mmetsp:Transcript_38271/g.46716  ORF Transcript_38271/g.46716 Transcript_38271/m.46716 type:complete len:215 (+) Transcript_38271:167-811(+)|eukprot:CAMPEP_0172499908 /NCGR_PEP_ID=MMETSP1066-20121228/132332_1 /TAXON_ID=671091 /ORGANISM="Coscinodiscus wailesii, Strain CCMP2513" /LENGTH=214 /DNA_ID=CAMNT_0013273897 /DNA_START=166 /DNA_END=810 /DNA_ORIENTATION=-